LTRRGRHAALRTTSDPVNPIVVDLKSFAALVQIYVSDRLFLLDFRR